MDKLKWPMNQSVKTRISLRYWQLKKEGWDDESKVWLWMFIILDEEEDFLEKLTRINDFRD